MLFLESTLRKEQFEILLSLLLLIHTETTFELMNRFWCPLLADDWKEIIWIGSFDLF